MTAPMPAARRQPPAPPAAQRFESLPVDALSAEHRDSWQRLRALNPTLRSPLFALPLVEFVAQRRPQVRVAVVREQGEIVALLPYALRRPGIAEPWAGELCDLHGAVQAPGQVVDVVELIRALGLRAWHFHAQLADQPGFAPHLRRIVESPYIEIRGGIDELLRRNSSHDLREALRKARKLSREQGTLEFRAHEPDPEALRQLLAWKSARLGAQRVFNNLERPWIRACLGELLTARPAGVTPMLGTLRLNGALISGYLGVLELGTLHGWVMSFNPEYARRSPGMVLLTRLLAEAGELGIERIDMGRGPEIFKRSLGSGALQVAEGSIDLRPILGTLRRRLIGVRDTLGEGRIKRWVHGWLKRWRYEQP